ncbi:serine hydrolase domain-containing protein [uncultured Thiodictyon sp.]|uniref:serine hydrolase domain-containing protein n=1 Tax=uncultured Thiodictyon sp. TaxID=1846217 RepID=UPI0025ECE8A6|nr:serine hydrolase domain-containing protein [uncultured Thiodictyon sp.]
MRRPRALRAVALAMAVGLLAATAASSAIAAEPSPPALRATASWSGPRLTTTPMGAADAAAIDTLAQNALAQSPDLPGLWIGVWEPAKGFYTQAYGEAVKGGAKATISDHGRIGSVTKTFTVVAVLEQIAAGRLKLESRIDEILPDLATKYPVIAGIRVDQLAGMRSGIQDYGNTGIAIKGVAADPTKVWTADDLIDAAMTLPLSAPGTGGYSTTNTIILGKMLEKLTGKPIDQIVTDVAKRAGLTQSALQAPDVTTMPDPASRGYVAATGTKEMEAIGATVAPGTDVSDWTVSWGQAGGGMYSTIADLGTWAGTGLGTSLLPTDLAAKRLAPQKIPDGDYFYFVTFNALKYNQKWYKIGA